MPGTDPYSFHSSTCRLGVDYGPRLIGTARSTAGLIEPLLTIRNHGNLVLLSEEIAKLAAKFQASEIVLGVPVAPHAELNNQRASTFNGKLCLQFSHVLSAVIKHMHVTAKVLLVDERFSTKEALLRIADGKRAGMQHYSDQFIFNCGYSYTGCHGGRMHFRELRRRPR
jgi:RNase H-fold protein (predicted Holliday junction resolvase)